MYHPTRLETIHRWAVRALHATLILTGSTLTAIIIDWWWTR